eukprot:SAG31_NODE_42311_length_272_cov_0.601156_1_plen_22_part_10
MPMLMYLGTIIVVVVATTAVVA